MSTRHVKHPTPLFHFFLPVPRFSCSTAPEAFSRPDRVLSQAGARRVCQGWPLFGGHHQGSAFTRPSTTAGLDGSSRLHSYLIFSRLRVGGGWCYCIPITDVIFLQVLLRGPWRVR